MHRPSQRGVSAGWGWAAVLASCILVAGVESVRLGLDANWDLKNYHFYNPYALLNGRLRWDVAPAQIQTYLSPFLDLPFYVMARADLSPRLVAFLMGIPAGVAAFFLFRIAATLFPARVDARPLWVGLAFAIGVTGSAGLAVLGSTMNEWPLAALVLAALYVLVSSAAKRGVPSARAVAVAGLLAGLAMGLKLSHAIYAIPLIATAPWLGAWPERLRRVLAMCAFALLGFALTYGPWGLTMYREFGSPAFPLFNSIFRSPYWEPVSFVDRRWGPQDIGQTILFPLYFAWRSDLVGETRFFDARFAVLLVLGVASAVRYGIQRHRLPLAPRWLLIAAFAITAYVLWLTVFGIYRYLVPLELLAGPLIVGCVLYLFRPGRMRTWVGVSLAAVLIASTQVGNWGRLEYADSYFEVTVPPLPADSLVIVAPYQPVSYLIPFLRADARFVAPISNLLNDTQDNLLAREASELIATHSGPLYSLGPTGDDSTSALAPYGIRRDDSACRPIRSNLDASSLELCGLQRVAR